MAFRVSVTALLHSVQEASNSKLRRARQRAKSTRKLDRRRESDLTDSVVAILKTGQPTYFAFEGACRAGVRSTLCLEGWPWMDADDAARGLVGKALNQIGAERPTYMQGQPDYAVEYGSGRSHCARPACGKRIPQERIDGSPVPVKYCSPLCKQLVHNLRNHHFGAQYTVAEYLALSAARSAETERERSRYCENPRCGKFFVTRAADRKYCSHECYAETARKLEDRECANPECRKVFTPKNGGPEKGITRYCSKECASVGRRKVRPALTCLTCNGIFYARYPSDKRSYCSPEHNPYASKTARMAAADTPPLAPDELEPVASAFRCDEV